MSARRGKKDANHDELRALFEQLGCSVIDTHATGIPGWPDIAVGCIGITHLVEVKNAATAYGRAGLNENQQVFNRDWRGEPVAVVSTQDDVIALVSKWRRAA